MSLTKIGGAVGDTQKIGVVNSVADLAGLVGKENGQQVSVKGYHAGSDVGGGIFYWNATSWATPNGGTIVSPGGQGRWFRVTTMSGVSVVEFGARGNGVTDDTAAIQSALSATSTGTVYFDSGIYVISAPIVVTSVNTSIEGRGFRRAVLSFTDTFEGPCVTFRPTNPLDDVRRSGNGIKGLTLQGGGSTRPDRFAVDIVKQEGFRMYDVQWSGFSYGVRVSGGQLNRLERITGQGSGRPAGEELSDSCALLFQAHPNTGGGFQPMYTTNVHDFYLAASLSRNVRDLIVVHAADGLNFVNGYIGLGRRSLMKLDPKDNQTIVAVTVENTYFDGVFKSNSGTDHGLFIPASSGSGTINATFGAGCFFGNYRLSCISAQNATNIRMLKFQGCNFSSANSSLGGVKGVAGSSGSRLTFSDCDFRGSNGGFVIEDARMLSITGCMFSDILGPAPFLEIKGTVTRKEISFTEAGNTTPFADSTAVVTALNTEWFNTGVFLPAVAIGGSSSGITYSTQDGKYTRVGNVMHFSASVVLTSKGGGSGDVSLTLPFSANGPTTTFNVRLSNVSDFVRSNSYDARVFNGGSTVVFSYGAVSGGATTSVPLQGSQLRDTSIIQVSGSYFI
jgi:hypothetical protein